MASIRTKMTWFVLIVGLIPLMGFGVAAILSARRAARVVAQDRNTHVATRAAREIDSFVDNSTTLLYGLAESLAQVSLDRRQTENLLIGHRGRFRRFSRLSVVGSDGTILASSDPKSPQRVADIDAILAEIETRDTFRSTRPAEPLEIPSMQLAIPIRRLGAVERILLADVDFVTLSDVVDSVRIGETGHALVITPDGTILAHGSPEGLPLAIRRERNEDLATRAQGLAGEDRMGITTGSLGQKALLVAVGSSSTGWTLLLEQDVSEAFEQARRLTLLLLALVVLGGFAAVMGGTAHSRRTVLKPVAALKEATQRFAGKDFAYRADLHTGDELEDLGGSLNDMATELGRAYEQLAATERARAFGLVSAGLAHDLKHPVGAIEAVEMRSREKPREKRLEIIGAAAERELPKLKEIIRRLRDIGTAGERRDTTFSAHKLARSLDTFRSRAEAKSVSLHADIDEVSLRADATLLSRAVDNLVSNALDAMNDSGGEVRLSLHVRGTLAEIRVADTGPGIPPELRDVLFEGFRTTRGSGGGLGIGLHVVQRIAVAHGGRVEVSSEVGEGTQVTMVLPIVAPAARTG